jgi:hypothetical protein
MTLREASAKAVPSLRWHNLNTSRTHCIVEWLACNLRAPQLPLHSYRVTFTGHQHDLAHYLAHLTGHPYTETRTGLRMQTVEPVYNLDADRSHRIRLFMVVD